MATTPAEAAGDSSMGWELSSFVPLVTFILDPGIIQAGRDGRRSGICPGTGRAMCPCDRAWQTSKQHEAPNEIPTRTSCATTQPRGCYNHTCRGPPDARDAVTVCILLQPKLPIEKVTAAEMLFVDTTSFVEPFRNN